MSKKRKQGGKHHAPEAELDTVHSAEHEDDFVYVPRGKSRGFYIFILVLMVFTLIIFVVPDQFQALFSPRQQTLEEFLVWEHRPTGARSSPPRTSAPSSSACTSSSASSRSPTPRRSTSSGTGGPAASSRPPRSTP